MKKKTSLLIAATTLLITGAVVGTTLAVNNVIKETAALVGTFVPSGSLRPSYSVGESLDFPDGHIEYEGNTVAVKSKYVIVPSGVAYNVDKVYFDNEGNYQLVYEGVFEGRTITAILNVPVYQKAYQVSKDGSYVNYTSNIITNQATIPGIEGCLVEGDSFVYGNVIDISQSDLTTPVFKYYTHTCSELAKHIGVDAYYSVVRLTDFYDRSIYVDISIGHYVANRSNGRLQQYCVAGASYQSLTGCQPSKNVATGTRKNVTIDDVDYVCYFGTTDYGTCLDTKPGTKGIDGTIYDPDISNSDNRGYSVFYDAATKQIYVKHDTLHFVTDLDNSSIYDRNTFKGFTTGEVIVSLSFNTFNENSAKFEIESILDTNGEDLNIIDSKDVKAPEIVLSNNNDNFKIAVNEEFQLFKADVKDLHPAGDATVEVYYEYGSAYELYIPVIDGIFIPRKVGRYTIIYTAKDAFNNVSTKIIECSAVNTPNGSIIDFDFDKVTTGVAGTYVDLGTPTFVTRNLPITYQILAIYEDGTCQILNNQIFRLKRVGTYNISYVVTDGIVTKTYDYDLNSTPGTIPYIDELTMPQLLIKGSKISLDDNRAVSCSSKELVLLDCDVYAKVDGGSYGASPIDQDEYEVTANKSVQFKYVYDNQLIAESEPIDVIDVGFTSTLNMLNYFVGDLSKQFGNNNEGAKLISAPGNENKAVFANPLSLSLFSLKLSLDSKIGTNCQKVNICLIDYYNPENMEVISLYFNNGLLKIKVNQQDEFTIGEIDKTVLSYDPLKGNLQYEKPNSIGTLPFGGNISKDKYYLAVEFVDVKTSSFIQIDQINNHSITSRTADVVKPQVYAYPFSGTLGFATQIIISPMIWCDVLSPSLKKDYKMTLEVTDNNGRKTYAVSQDGVVLDGTQDYNREYIVVASTYGSYIATYTCQDQAYKGGVFSPNKQSTGISAYVIDDIAPVITVDTSKATASLGSTVGVRGYSVKDNITPTNDIVVNIYVISPIGNISDITSKKNFVADVAGEYKVIYYATDAANNISSVSYVVDVR